MSSIFDIVNDLTENFEESSDSNASRNRKKREMDGFPNIVKSDLTT